MTAPEWEDRLARRIYLLAIVGRWEDAEDIGILSRREKLFRCVFIERLKAMQFDEAEARAHRAPDPGPYLNGIAVAMALQFRWKDAERLADNAAEHGVTDMQNFLLSAQTCWSD